MLVYEEYASNREKRLAQRGAKLGKPTGKARGYTFVFNENGTFGAGLQEAVGSVFELEPGEGPERGLASTAASRDYLRLYCRRIGGKHLPSEWRKVWNHCRTPK